MALRWVYPSLCWWYKMEALQRANLCRRLWAHRSLIKQRKKHLQFCVETSPGNLENSVKGTLAATQAGWSLLPWTHQEGRAERTEPEFEDSGSKGCKWCATREADPGVPLHWNSILSGKSNKIPWNQGKNTQFRAIFLLKICKTGHPSIEIFDIFKMQSLAKSLILVLHCNPHTFQVSINRNEGCGL